MFHRLHAKLARKVEFRNFMIATYHRQSGLSWKIKLWAVNVLCPMSFLHCQCLFIYFREAPWVILMQAVRWQT